MSYDVYIAALVVFPSIGNFMTQLCMFQSNPLYKITHSAVLATNQDGVIGHCMPGVGRALDYF